MASQPWGNTGLEIFPQPRQGRHPANLPNKNIARITLNL
jgi:hypothetical protein